MTARWAVGVALAACAGCGDQAIAPVDVAPGCPAVALDAGAPGESVLVDDFEDGDDRASPPAAGRWAFTSDSTSKDVSMQNASACAALGKRSLHFRGTGLTGWGAESSVGLRRASGDKPADFDASGYDAVAFYGATTAGTRDTPLRASVSTVDGDPAFGICKDCYDSYGTTVTLTSAWRRYVVPIDGMLQWGWGVPQIAPPRRDHLVEVLFYAEGTFDVWIDDVRLVRTR